MWHHIHMVGIVSYGTYIPKYRVALEEIARVWRKDPVEVIRSLGLVQKSVPASDEDAVTMAIEAAQQCLTLVSGRCNPEAIGALFVGSESHPYAVNPTSTIVGELLGIGREYLAADMQFACKAATTGIQAISGLVNSGHIDYGLAIGTDSAQSKPHDALEYTSAAASVAVLLGKKNVAARLVEYVSYSSDTPDFWRRDGIRYPSHAGRFTGEPAYFAHVEGAARLLLTKSNSKVSGFTYCVFHMPNGKFPKEVAKRLGFTDEQLAPSLTVSLIGNPYSASSLLGLAAVLDQAQKGDTIFMVSYGSGAGSDGFIWQVEKDIEDLREERGNKGFLVHQQVEHTIGIDYAQYLKQTNKI